MYRKYGDMSMLDIQNHHEEPRGNLLDLDSKGSY